MEHSISRDSDAIWCSRQATVIAESMGFGTTAIWEIAISVSELVTNVIKYAGTGKLILEKIEKPHPGIQVIVEDQGPGIADIDVALQDGFTEGKLAELVPLRERRGLGAGLGAVHRLMDEVHIENRAKRGTRVRATKYLRV